MKMLISVSQCKLRVVLICFCVHKVSHMVARVLSRFNIEVYEDGALFVLLLFVRDRLQVTLVLKNVDFLFTARTVL